MSVLLQSIQYSRILSRGKHFLAGVPLKKRGVEGSVDPEQFKEKVNCFLCFPGKKRVNCPRLAESEFGPSRV